MKSVQYQTLTNSVGPWGLMPGIRGTATKENAQIVRALLMQLFPDISQDVILQAAAHAKLALKRSYNEIDLPTDIVRGIAKKLPVGLTAQQNDLLKGMDEACRQRARQITTTRNAADDAESGIGDFLTIIGLVAMVVGIPPIWQSMQAAFGAAEYGICALAADGSIVSIVGGVSTTLLPAEIVAGQCIFDAATGNIIDSITGNVLIDSTIADTAALSSLQINLTAPPDFTFSQDILTDIATNTGTVSTANGANLFEMFATTAVKDIPVSVVDVAKKVLTDKGTDWSIKSLLSTGMSVLSAATAVNTLLNAKTPGAQRPLLRDTNGAITLADGTIILPDGTVIPPRAGGGGSTILDTLTSPGVLLAAGGVALFLIVKGK